MKNKFWTLLFYTSIFILGAISGYAALTKTQTFVNGQILTAANLNNEFANIYDNAHSLINPLTATLNCGGYDLTSVGDITSSGDITADTITLNNFTIISELYGDGSGGTIANLTDIDAEGITIAQTGVASLTDNRIIRATGNITLTQTITVGKQSGQARGSYPATHGSPGIPLGSVMTTLGSKGIPATMRPGGDTASMNGGRVQLISGGTVAVGGAINAVATNASGEGGGAGGLVVIIAATSITGSSNIDVSGAGGHATAGAKAGSGSYSEGGGGNCGYGGSGGGGCSQDPNYGTGGSGGTGFVSGKAGGAGSSESYKNGGGGGCLDEVGDAGAAGGGRGGDGIQILAGYYQNWYVPVSDFPTPNAAGAGNGGAGSNGGGGGGGNDGGTAGGNGGDYGSGGGGGSGGTPVNGGNGANGGAELFPPILGNYVYAGMPGGQGAGGGGASYATPGSAGTGASGASVFVASMGNGDGGAGANGAAGSSIHGGAGGSGGNGGGAAGLVLMISPSITYSGTVTGRLVKIDGAAAINWIRGYDF